MRIVARDYLRLWWVVSGMLMWWVGARPDFWTPPKRQGKREARIPSAFLGGGSVLLAPCRVGVESALRGKEAYLIAAALVFPITNLYYAPSRGPASPSRYQMAAREAPFAPARLGARMSLLIGANAPPTENPPRWHIDVAHLPHDIRAPYAGDEPRTSGRRAIYPRRPQIAKMPGRPIQRVAICRYSFRSMPSVVTNFRRGSLVGKSRRSGVLGRLRGIAFSRSRQGRPGDTRAVPGALKPTPIIPHRPVAAESCALSRRRLPTSGYRNRILNLGGATRDTAPEPRFPRHLTWAEIARIAIGNPRGEAARRQSARVFVISPNCASQPARYAHRVRSRWCGCPPRLPYFGALLVGREADSGGFQTRPRRNSAMFPSRAGFWRAGRGTLGGDRPVKIFSTVYSSP